MNNIWHTSIFIPDPFKAHPIIVIYEAGDEIEQMMSNEYRARVGERYVNRWCYVNDLLNCEKALGVALDWLGQVATPEKCDDDLCREFTKRKLAEIKTALEQKEHFADVSKKVEQKE